MSSAGSAPRAASAFGPEGLRVSQTRASRDALRRVSASDGVGTPALRADAASFADEATVPFRVLRDVAAALRASGGGGPYLQDLAAGATLALASPPPRPPRDPALEARCASLRRALDRAAYDDMTRDVAARPPAAGGLKMSALTRDLGFAAHVVTVAAACFVGGAFVGRSIVMNGGDQSDVAVPAVCGAVAAFAAMIVEALLFILRDAKT